MGRNSWGKIVTLTTAGESHGKGYVGILDGIPSGFNVDIQTIQRDLDLRAPGRSDWTSARKESDQIEILSGIYEGKTLGTPIAFLIKNIDQRSQDYSNLTQTFRPGHADYTYTKKYGHVDLRGGGRSSARETVLRVAAGSIAKQILQTKGVNLVAYVRQIHDIRSKRLTKITDNIKHEIVQDPIGCFDPNVSSLMQQAIATAKEEGDSVGGSICFLVDPMLPNLGEPIYRKFSSVLAEALMTIPAAKGMFLGEFEDLIGTKGSKFNDPFIHQGDSIISQKNDAAGLLGGISTGESVFGEIFFKPPSSISKTQKTQDKALNIQGRHDPVVVPRARIVVEAMLWLVILDMYLESKTNLHG